MFLHKSRTTLSPWRMIAKDYVGNRIILTHGFVKKTQKTLPREIERAKEYRALYQQREEHRHG
ncbi:MAG: type II toxin-antitoxin system RelE/ParE family toxin [Selenomonas sp.]|nr:type II toxin-antitoxin system RelE/ParE family toxin [Selenomonas sp.]MBF1694540.1 type II toxin-antitoxin system RelE/ParE family toxin [Selenomonas sp.]MBF1695235.1 type II toxin-antitoxin system RelE/ParE family toxin [Selenomonas sp.]